MMAVIMSFLFMLLFVLLAAVMGVVLLGLFSMVKGGEFNAKYGNKLMVARVVLQALALAVLLLLVLLKK